MIQRIQSVYLLIVALIFIVLLFLGAIAGIQTSEGTFSFDLFGLKTTAQPSENILATSPLVILSAAISVFSLIIIFLFKNRVLQKRLCILNTILMIIFCGLTAFYFRQISLTEGFDSMVISYRFPIILPLTAIIFNIMALTSIGKDEKLVRSLDRIR
jgi:hypothetical protein